MGIFLTEKETEEGLKGFFMPILLPNGKKEMAEVTRSVRTHYEVLREIGVPETRLMRYAKKLKKNTGLPYKLCYSMGILTKPDEFFEGWPSFPFYHQ